MERRKVPGRPFLRLLLVGFTVMFSPAPSFAEDWLPPGSATEKTSNIPPEILRPGTAIDDRFLYGRLLFRSPEILGEKAVRIGLSCDSCHTNGDVNTDFHILGLSDRPGRVDVSHRFWQAGFDDGIDNPIDIPSLRGVGKTAPYGTLKIFANLHAFTSHVITEEFGGPLPLPGEIEALVTYMNSFDINALNKSDTHVKTNEDMSYLPLLETPLQDHDYAKIDELTDRIRADIGRRATALQQDDAIRLIKGLIDIRNKAAQNEYEEALELYRSLRQ